MAQLGSAFGWILVLALVASCADDEDSRCVDDLIGGGLYKCSDETVHRKSAAPCSAVSECADEPAEIARTANGPDH